MQSSGEVLTLLLKVMGTVFGIAIISLATFLFVKEPGTRRTVVRVWAFIVVIGRFLFGVASEYSKVLGTLCSQYLLSKAKKDRANTVDAMETM